MATDNLLLKKNDLKDGMPFTTQHSNILSARRPDGLLPVTPNSNEIVNDENMFCLWTKLSYSSTNTLLSLRINLLQEPHFHKQPDLNDL